MKKIISVLIIVLLTMISAGKFAQESSVYFSQFKNDFKMTINLTTQSESPAEVISELQKSAKENNISFIKAERIPKNSRYGKLQVNIYTFLNNADWFKKSFRNISIDGNNSELNSFKKANYVNLLTSNEIKMIPFDNIKHDKLNGDYHIRGKKSDVINFINCINDNSKLKTEIVPNPDFTISSDYTQKQAILYCMAILVLFVAVVFCLVIYNGILSKEISISLLLGYNPLHLIFNKLIEIFLYPVFGGVLLSIAYISYFIRPSNIMAFIFSIRPIFNVLIFVIILIVAIESLLLFRKISKIDIIAWLKGYRKTYNKSSYLIKITSVVIVLYLAVSSLLGALDYIHLKQYISTWENAKNYADLACAWSWAYEKDDDKFNEIVVPKLNDLWNRLDDNGAILFNAPFMQTEGMQVDDKEYIDRQAFHGKYAYVNNNYLKISSIEDVKGKNISEYSCDRNQWIIFVPADTTVSAYDKALLHKAHTFSNSDKNSILTEKYVQLKNNQYVFTFDSKSKIDESILPNYALVLINGKEMDPTHGIKLASLVNGELHPYIKDPAKPYDNIQEIVKQAHAEEFILYVNTVYDEVIIKINSYRMEAMVYLIGFILSIIILSMILKIDIEVYFYNDGQRIDVSRLLGYKFRDIHKEKIMKNAIGHVVSLLSLFLFIICLNKFHIGAFQPRNGWHTWAFVISLIVGVCGIALCFGIEILQLKKGENSLVRRLKEGC